MLSARSSILGERARRGVALFRERRRRREEHAESDGGEASEARRREGSHGFS
jgi:hypothetical protein